jgi:hypothetical protein
MADANGIAAIALALVAYLAAVLLQMMYNNGDPKVDGPLSEFAQFFSRYIVFVAAGVLAYFFWESVAAWYSSSSTDGPDHNEAKANPTAEKEQRGVDSQANATSDKESRKALKASGSQVAQHADTYGAHLERLRQRATQIRESQRIIQNQTTALERSEHRADAAERTARTKDNIIKVQSTFLEIRDSKIEDQRDIIALQAQQIKDSHFDLQDMAQQIEQKDQQTWEVAGNLTVAEQEIIKLRAAVADKSTTSDYCAALDAVHRRDANIYVLQKQLAQQAKDSEFNQETVDSLADVLMTLGDKPPVEAVRDLEAWAMEREARFDDFVTHSGPVVIAAQQDACQNHRDTIDIQHKMLRNALETRDRQGKTVAEVKAQLAALIAREEHNIKIYNQTIGEKQHLLNALNHSQNSLQAAKSELHRRGTELSAMQIGMSHHALQQAIDGKKAKSASKEDAAQKAKLETLTKQLATMDKQLEASEVTRVQEVAMMNNKLCMIREALKLTGLDCDLWTIEYPDELASLLQHTLSNEDQEDKLAETCAELSATNSNLQTTLTTQTTALADLKSELKMIKARHHKEFKDWQSTLCKVDAELKTAKRSSRSRDLENKIIALEIRLKLANDDNKILADAKFHAEEKAKVLTRAVTEQAERLKYSRETLEGCVKANKKLYEKVGLRGQQVEDLTKMLEGARGAWGEEHDEKKKLRGLLECREEEVRELEGVREGLEKKLFLLGEEFVEVTEEDVSDAAAVEDVDEEEEEFVVEGEEVDCFADEFKEVDAYEEENVDCFADEFEEVDVDEENVNCFADEFEEVEVIEGVEVDENVDCFADEFEAVEVDEDWERL